jgi:hypothetical protein
VGLAALRYRYQIVRAVVISGILCVLAALGFRKFNTTTVAGPYMGKPTIHEELGGAAITDGRYLSQGRK